MAGRHDEVRAAIVAAHQDLVATLDSMSPDDMRRLSPNEGWTAKDTLAHLCTIEERLCEQIQAILDGKPFPSSEDVNTFNARKVAERETWTVPQLRDELERERATTLALLDRLNDADLAREFDHPRRGRIKLEGIWETLYTHMRTHTADIAATRASAAC